MNRFRHILLVIVMVNALLALFLWLTETRMPGWFAAVLALASLALVCVRVFARRSSTSASRA